MGTDRNGPCPCGSGIKYKKCHGIQSVQSAKSAPDKFELNRAIAYKGVVGKDREAFCNAYTTSKITMLTSIAANLRKEAEESGKHIFCSRGCSHCCKMCVVASLQECEAIVHYLYHHEPTLKLFLRNFGRWNDRILKIADSFRTINTLHTSITVGEASEAEIREFDAACARYAVQDIPCPFLSENACSIYGVRPYVCARIVALTPPEWCRAGHPRQHESVHLKAQMQVEKDMPYFSPLANNCTFSSMPFLVYRLLYEGYDALSSVPGLEKLRDSAYSDPEVRATLKGIGVS